MPVFTAIAASLASLGAAAGGAASTAGGLGAIAGGIGTAAGLAGTALQFSGQQKAASAAEQAERLRQSQMNMEAIRQRRAAVRQSIVARGAAVSNATNQGAGDGSGLQGGIAQIGGQKGNNLTGIDNGVQLGNGMFQANAAQAAGQTQSSFGSGISSLGGALVKNQEAIGRVGANMFGFGAAQP